MQICQNKRISASNVSVILVFWLMGDTIMFHKIALACGILINVFGYYHLTLGHIDIDIW